jgi:hypothetical protein
MYVFEHTKQFWSDGSMPSPNMLNVPLRNSNAGQIIGLPVFSGTESDTAPVPFTKDPALRIDMAERRVEIRSNSGL